MKQFEGTWRLLRLAVRRDRIKLTISIVAIGILMPLMVTGIKDLILDGPGSSEELIAFLASNPAMRLFGLPTGGDIGNLLMLRAYVFVAFVIALISTFTVIRHTRQNEELGRTELIGSSVVGRNAPLAAALLLAILANVLIALLIYLGLVADELPTTGSLAMAVAFGVVGILFSGIAAVCAQLTKTSRAANALAASTVGVAFLTSGIASVMGDLQQNAVAVEPSWVIWLSPIGWGQLLYPFANENWHMLGFYAAVFALLIILAFYLSRIRDIGGSIFPSRAGRAEAKKQLLSIPGLTWRLQRTQFFGWLIGILFISATYGVVSSSIENIMSMAQAEGFGEIFTGATDTEDIVLAYLGAVASIIGIATLCYVVQSIQKVRSEETRALEKLLSTSVSRVKWLITNFVYAILSGVAILILSGATIGFIVNMVLETPIDNIVTDSIIGSLVQVPAILVIASIVILLFAFIPRMTIPLAWIIVTISILFSPFFGSLFSFPDWVLNVSPLSHTPIVPPVENITSQPLIVLSVIALIISIVGLIRFQHRDIDNV